jgi:selenocysteine-specific elongation factor
MYVIATAGHVDHGKSALVRALTGMEPDRWAEEQRRGMTIDLGYAWTSLPSGAELAFVDVPGHERFMTNMLAGVGPVPAVLLVVSADEGWSAQTAEHVAALDALSVRHGVLAVTRSDLADPATALAGAREHLSGTSLETIEAVAVSSLTGVGLPELRASLDRLVSGLPSPAADGRVRLWVDRSFSVRGYGTVLTGTLAAGTVAVDDRFELGQETVSVRGVEMLGHPVPQASAPARVALNLRSVPREKVRRGRALLTPGAWHLADEVDVLCPAGAGGRMPRQLVLHIGSAAVPVDVRAIGPQYLRLRLRSSLPLQVGDRAVLRDPGMRRVLSGAVVLDPAPPAMTGRGAAKARAQELARVSVLPDLAGEVERRGVVSRALLTQLGVAWGPLPSGAVEEAGWVIGAPVWQRWQHELERMVTDETRRPDRLVRSGVAGAEVVQRLGLPNPALLTPLVGGCPGLVLAAADVRLQGLRRALDPGLAEALAPLLALLERSPFRAPEASELVAAGAGARQLSAAAAADVLLVLPGGIVLRPDAPQRAAGILARLPQPFTLSAARQALGTSRRVALPLLEHMDRRQLTERVDEMHRTCVNLGPMGTAAQPNQIDRESARS